jgi:hypothetical protein
VSVVEGVWSAAEGVWSVVEGVWSVVESHVVFPPPPLHVPVVCSCQTYEGGFSGVPWSEAHGGYTFCAVASLAILGAMQRADVDALKVGVPPHPAHCPNHGLDAWNSLLADVGYLESSGSLLCAELPCASGLVAHGA